tara:strand:+ start:115 stop:690 length:576 start_codon:yes stop_codon:yes gene_type:complete
MSFFKNLTLERAFILLSLLGSAALLYIGLQTQGELSELSARWEDQKTSTGVKVVANELQELSRKYSSLHKAKMGEGFLGQENVESYIRRCKDAKNAEIGQISISHNENELDRKVGLFDHVYTIKTQSSDTTLGRRNIVTFLRELELKSQQIRVTSLQLRLSGKGGRVKPHEIPPDKWLFDAVCTSRVKQDA